VGEDQKLPDLCYPLKSAQQEALYPLRRENYGSNETAGGAVPLIELFSAPFQANYGGKSQSLPEKPASMPRNAHKSDVSSEGESASS